VNATLTVTVGLPRSGKSTYATHMARFLHLPVVCCDEIRKAMGAYPFIPESEPLVRYTEQTMVKALLGAGCPHVIIDSTNLTRAIRAAWESLVPGVAVEYVYVPTSAELCIERAKATGQPYLVPVIERMWLTFESLTADEYTRAMDIDGNLASYADIPWSEPS
jgi:predicted kinase